MTITLARCNAVRHVIKHTIDDLEADFPGLDVTALHEALAKADALFYVVAQRVWMTGPTKLDGTPKPPPSPPGP